MRCLAEHPDVARQEDTSQGSGLFTYWDDEHATFRQLVRPSRPAGETS